MKPTRTARNLTLIIFLFVMFIVALARPGQAQNLEFSTMAQQTVMGLQKGYAVAFRTKSGWGVGSFFQSTNHLSFEQSADNYPFYGVDISAPLKTCGDLQLLAHVKTGLVNQDFLIATPELETRYKINPFLKIAIGAGYRSQQAAISATLILNTI